MLSWYFNVPPPQNQLSLFGSNYQWNKFLLIFQHPRVFKGQNKVGCWGIQQMEGIHVRIFQRYTTKVTHYNREIKPIDTSAKDMDELQADLCDFIVEIRKENGEQYPSSSMYDLISGLSLYLEREHGFTNKLVSRAFRAVRNTLDNVMKERTADRVGGGLRGIPSWRNMSKYCGRRVYWGRTVLTNWGKLCFFDRC